MYIYLSFCLPPHYLVSLPLLASYQVLELYIEERRGTEELAMNTMKTSSSSNNTKKMRPRKGFMCQSPASTAICMSTGDPRSVVIIPRKTTADHGGGIDQHSLLLNKNNHHHSSSTTASNRYSSRLLADSHQVHQHQPRQKINTTSTNLCSTHDHYHKKSSSAFIRDNRGGRVIPPPPPLPALPSNFQVVVMRVSLHCQGCAGKVKKHLSKMEGVTSFSIDLEMKRVTVMGHVSPVGVLESISKVKRAEFWTSTSTTC